MITDSDFTSSTEYPFEKKETHRKIYLSDTRSDTPTIKEKEEPVVKKVIHKVIKKIQHTHVRMCNQRNKLNKWLRLVYK